MSLPAVKSNQSRRPSNPQQHPVAEAGAGVFVAEVGQGGDVVLGVEVVESGPELLGDLDGARWAGVCCFVDGVTLVLAGLALQHEDEAVIVVLVKYVGRGEYALACSDTDLSVSGDVHRESPFSPGDDQFVEALNDIGAAGFEFCCRGAELQRGKAVEQ